MVLVVLIYIIACSFACTNLIVTKKASAEEYNMFSYNADSHTLYGELYNLPAADHVPGDKRKIYDWETGHYLGDIPEINHTFAVIGNMNSEGVAIGETTWGGIASLQQQPGAIIDYGSLMYIALQRSSTARQAIDVMTDLVKQYGYASEGESFTIGDANEIWIMDMIGKGPGRQGAVWVATRIPDGAISGHANFARHTTFNWTDPDNVLYSPDVMTFAQEIGRYSPSGSKEEFDFTKAYYGMDFDGARFCDARVWSFFRHVLGPGVMDKYIDYVSGKNLTGPRMDLYYIVPDGTTVTLKELGECTGDHFEGTVFEFNSDIGAGPYLLPYRWRPMEWESGGGYYFNERSAGTQQTGWNFVAALRGMSSAGPGYTHPILWFGVDDSATTVRIPFYPTITRVPFSLTRIDLSQDIMTFSTNSTFWVFNLVSNFVYGNYLYLYPLLKDRQDSLFDALVAGVNDADDQIKVLEPEGDDVVNEYLTKVCNSWASLVITDWLNFFKEIFPRWMDGVNRIPNPGQRNPRENDVGYPNAWYNRIVLDTGDKYLEPK